MQTNHAGTHLGIHFSEERMRHSSGYAIANRTISDNMWTVSRTSNENQKTQLVHEVLEWNMGHPLHLQIEMRADRSALEYRQLLDRRRIDEARERQATRQASQLASADWHPPPSRTNSPPLMRPNSPPPMRANSPPPMRANSPPPMRANSPPPMRANSRGGGLVASPTLMQMESPTGMGSAARPMSRAVDTSASDSRGESSKARSSLVCFRIPC